MPDNAETKSVRETLQKIQDGYTNRDLSKLDEFMGLFAPTDEIELIGVGASERGGREWIRGRTLAPHPYSRASPSHFVIC